MRTELKIGIVAGIVVVAVAIVLIARRTEKVEAPVPVTAPVLEQKAIPAPPPVTAAAEANAVAAPTSPVAVAPAPGIESKVEKSVPAVASEPSLPETRYYVVTAGDTLSSIAEKYYGNGKFWKVVYEANRQVIKSPNALKAGWKLRIPYPKEVAAAPVDTPNRIR